MIRCAWIMCKHNTCNHRGDLGKCNYTGNITLRKDKQWEEYDDDIDALACMQYEAEMLKVIMKRRGGNYQ